MYYSLHLDGGGGAEKASNGGGKTSPTFLYFSSYLNILGLEEPTLGACTFFRQGREASFLFCPWRHQRNTISRWKRGREKESKLAGNTAATRKAPSRRSAEQWKAVKGARKRNREGGCTKRPDRVRQGLRRGRQRKSHLSNCLTWIVRQVGGGEIIGTYVVKQISLSYEHKQKWKRSGGESHERRLFSSLLRRRWWRVFHACSRVSAWKEEDQRGGGEEREKNKPFFWPLVKRALIPRAASAGRARLWWRILRASPVTVYVGSVLPVCR